MCGTMLSFKRALAALKCHWRAPSQYAVSADRCTLKAQFSRPSSTCAPIPQPSHRPLPSSYRIPLLYYPPPLRILVHVRKEIIPYHRLLRRQARLIHDPKLPPQLSRILDAPAQCPQQSNQRDVVLLCQSFLFECGAVGGDEEREAVDERLDGAEDDVVDFKLWLRCCFCF